MGIAAGATKPDRRGWIAGMYGSVRPARRSRPAVVMQAERRQIAVLGGRGGAKDISGTNAHDKVRIARRPTEAVARRDDLVVIGRAGSMASRSPSKRRNGAIAWFCSSAPISTSWCRLRIIHGGLRYLQSLNLRRFRELVAEPHWLNGVIGPAATGA